MQILALSLLMSLGVLPAVQGGRKCTNPKGNDGESYTEGCLKMTCKAEVWMSSLDASSCCYNRQPYLPNTTITAAEDGCATAVIYCTQKDDVATVVLQVENKCGEHSTEEQVQEIKHLLVKHMEQTDWDRDTPVPTSASSTTTTPTTITPTTTTPTTTTPTTTIPTTTTPTTTIPTTTTPTHATEGILVSGGWREGNEKLKSVELFIPETGKTVSFPDLPLARFFHTMNMVGDAIVVCGGEGDRGSSKKSCVHLSPPSSSVWTSYATTRKERSDHTAWVSPSGELLLVGGHYSAEDAEIVNAGTSTGREIRLEQAARYHCGIDAKDSVILTGGYGSGSERRVARYNLQGREDHGCSSYLSDGTMVLIVAGGRVNGEVLSSTERMAIGAAAWTTVKALPRALYYMASLTVGNLVYLTGGRDKEYDYRSEVLVLDGEDWREIGRLQIPRGRHAATMIDTASFMEFCN